MDTITPKSFPSSPAASGTFKDEQSLRSPKQDDSSATNVKVVARFRPPNTRELSENGQNIVEFDKGMTTVHVSSKDYPGSYSFDRIYDWNASQQSIFEYTAASIVSDVMKGYNGTVFAYGQTGAGKTYTMMGSDIKSSEGKGLVPRIVERIFETIGAAPPSTEFTVKVSYMEIYMERLRDLLNPANDNLPVHEDKSRGVYVKGLLEVYVSNVDEVFQIMQRGQENRVVASTQMNAESSRSHSIFVVHISQKPIPDDSSMAGASEGDGSASVSAGRTGKLYLVDLAGSEKVGKTGATGQTLEEAKKINKSLSALGMVINALTDGKSSHIPYRDSKLTRILQESLGGNSRTTLIINCSPSSFNESETVSTLRFGQRAKSIKNKAKMNVELTAAELKKLLKRSQAQVLLYQDYMSRALSELQQWRGGSKVPPEAWVSDIPALLQSPTDVAPSTDTFNFNSHAVGQADSFFKPQTAEGGTCGYLALEGDEREEFLTRENELQDQLVRAEREAEQAKETEKILVAQVAQMQLYVEQLKAQVDNANVLAQEFKETEKSLESEKSAMALRVKELEEKVDHANSEKLMEIEAERLRFKEEKLRLLLRDTLNGSARAVEDGQTSEFDSVPEKDSIERQLSILEAQRKRWMKDVQDRCEKVIDLEMQLADALDENERLKLNSERLSPSKAKLDVLEHNLDQLAQVQTQLVNELNTVRRQHQTDKLKLKQKEDRLSALESFVQNLQRNLERQNEHWAGTFKQVSQVPRATNSELAKRDSLVSKAKIAKPLRGGGATGIASHSAIEGEGYY